MVGETKKNLKKRRKLRGTDVMLGKRRRLRRESLSRVSPTLRITWLSSTKIKRPSFLNIRLKVGSQVFLSTLNVTLLPLVNTPSKPQGRQNKKRKGKAEHPPSNHGAVSHEKKKSLNAHPNPAIELDIRNDDTSNSESDCRPVKKQKTNYVAIPFRQTG